MGPASARSNTLYAFRHPNVKVRLALGRKRGAWYLVYARSYGTGEPREVVRLDKPGIRTHQRGDTNSRFWFNTRAASGWERNGQSLLDLLLSLDPHDPPVLALASSNTLMEEKYGAMEVEVLIPEHRLAHWCEGCGFWETIETSPRWALDRPGKRPGYLCMTCDEKDWFGSRFLRRYLHLRRGLL